ncbi:MAG: OmpA family protein [Bacteroidota bacterium]
MNRLLVLALLPLLAGCASTLDRMGDVAANAAGRAVDRQVDRRTDRAVTGAIDGAFRVGENAVRCAFDDDACIRRANDRGEDVVLVDSNGNYVDRSGRPVDPGDEAAIVRTSIANANANYDFTPGERALFSEDFANDRVGDFPRSLYFLSGTGEVVDFQGQRFLRYSRSGGFQIQLSQTLPGRFTIEFDAQVGGGGAIQVYTAPPSNPGNDTRPFADYEENKLVLGGMGGYSESGLYEGWRTVISGERLADLGTGVVRVEVTVDDGYVKMYADGDRIANVPRADLGRHDAVTFLVGARDDRLVYIGNIRIAAGGNDLYGALSSEGRVVAEGLTFDTASATLRPESFAVVQEIASMMQANPGLRVRVEGHTDNTGNAAANQRLSEQRANAVRTMLVGLGVAEGRLEAVGRGPSQPVASNDTEAGRQQNRRVELVRL